MVLAIATAAALSLTAAAGSSDEASTGHDLNALRMANDACRNEEFSSLLQAMAISDAVVAHYSAPRVAVVIDGLRNLVPREAYSDFPIGMIDYYWVSRSSMRSWEANPDIELVHLRVERNQSPNNQWRIDWTPVRYSETESDGDDLGDVIAVIGQPGYLLFEPVGDCWVLVEQGIGGP